MVQAKVGDQEIESLLPAQNDCERVDNARTLMVASSYAGIAAIGADRSKLFLPILPNLLKLVKAQAALLPFFPAKAKLVASFSD
ncbi:MAG: hypothetical protein WD468_07835 [Pirellulales bacterium]